MNKMWLIGDLHFGHKKIIEYCNRPFSDVEEMNKTLISNWNSVVGKNDEVIAVGDFALMSKDNIIDIGRQLKGRKTLILGNHDQASIQTYYEAGFEFVSKYPIVKDEFAIISHEPLFTNTTSPYVNIFAHVHDNENFKSVSCCGCCVSAERINYTPILYDKVKMWIYNEILNSIK